MFRVNNKDTRMTKKKTDLQEKTDFLFERAENFSLFVAGKHRGKICR